MLFAEIERLIGIGEEAFSRIFAIHEGHADAQGNLRDAIFGDGKEAVHFIHLILNRIAQIAGHIHHDHREFVAADAADVIDGTEGGSEKTGHFL